MCYLELENESESSSITGNFVASRIIMLRYDVRQAMLLGIWPGHCPHLIKRNMAIMSLFEMTKTALV